MRLVSAIVVSAYVLGTLGVLPSPAVIGRWLGQGALERHPCEGHGCGCVFAEECWTACCCFGTRERLVWAISNGVDPPDGVEFSDAEWIAAKNTVRARVAQVSKPVARVSSLCGDVPEREKTRLSSGESADALSGCCDALAVDPPEPRVSWVAGTVSAQSCKGLTQLLAFALPVAPRPAVEVVILPEPVPFVPEWPGEAELLSRLLDVPSPPPRLG